MWEVACAFSCAQNMRLTREQLNFVMQDSAQTLPLAEGALERLYDLANKKESEDYAQNHGRRPTSPTRSFASTRAAESFRGRPGTATGRCPTCEICGGRGHTRDSPHLVNEYGVTCNRKLLQWEGRCSGKGHAEWQCPGLYQVDPTPGSVRRCKKCLGLCQDEDVFESGGAHPETNTFLAKTLACEVCSGLGHWWRTCPHAKATETVDIRELARLRHAYLAESLLVAGRRSQRPLSATSTASKTRKP